MGGANSKDINHLQEEATQLVNDLKAHTLFLKLGNLVQSKKQYELYTILKTKMLPCEIMYFMDVVLKNLLYQKAQGGSSIEDHMMIKCQTYISIYKKLVQNADAIEKEVDVILQQGGKIKNKH